jgi:hypothetical protein
MVRSSTQCCVSNHEATAAASSFETRFALLRMRGNAARAAMMKPHNSTTT